MTAASPPAPEAAAEEPAPARRRRRALLISLLGLSALLFLAMLYRGFALLGATAVAETGRPRELILGPPTAAADKALGAGVEPGPGPAAAPTMGAPSWPPPAVSSTFAGFYEARGSLRIFGLPIAPPQRVSGREIQWFERGRLEHWPELAGTPYEVLSGRVGVEYTRGREFARQSPFASMPGLRYFPETGHAVGGVFLSFWEQNGGLDILGLPISEAFDEVMADGVAYRVQYFERARLEYHPEHAGTPSEVQLGLLGTALLRNEPRPSTVQPVPTMVPIP